MDWEHTARLSNRSSTLYYFNYQLHDSVGTLHSHRRLKTPPTSKGLAELNMTAAGYVMVVCPGAIKLKV